MTTVILKGQEAIHYAEVHHLLLHRYADATGAARDDLSLEDARQIAGEHPELIWVETHIGVNSGEPDEPH